MLQIKSITRNIAFHPKQNYGLDSRTLSRHHWLQHRRSSIGLKKSISGDLLESDDSLLNELDLTAYQENTGGLRQDGGLISPIANRRKAYFESNRFSNREKALFSPIRDLIVDGKLPEALTKLKAADTLEIRNSKLLLPILQDAFYFGKRRGAPTQEVIEFAKFVLTLKSDQRTYSSVITGCAMIGDGENMGFYFKEFVEKGFTPDRFLFHQFIQFCVRRNLVKEALQYCKSMMLFGLEPNHDTAELLSGFVKATLPIQEQRQILDLLLHQNLLPSVRHVNIFFSLLRDHLDEIMKYFQRLKELKFSPNSDTFNMIITACVRNKNLDKALDMLNMMKKDYSIIPSVQTLNHILQGYSNTGDMERTEEWLWNMRSVYGVQPNSSSYCILLTALMRKGLVDKADSLFNSMAKTMLPSTIAYNIMISGYCRRNMESKALEYFELMKKDNVQPDSYSYAALMNFYYNRKDLDTMTKLLAEAEQSGANLDATVYSWFVILHAHRGNYTLSQQFKDKIEALNMLITE